MQFPGKPKNSADINVKLDPRNNVIKTEPIQNSQINNIVKISDFSVVKSKPGTKLPRIEQTRSLSVLRTISRKKLNNEAQQEPQVLRFTYFRCPMCKNPYWQRSEVELHIIGTHNMTSHRLKTMLTCGEIKIIEEIFQTISRKKN